jgi:hypothetical protein
LGAAATWSLGPPAEESCHLPHLVRIFEPIYQRHHDPRPPMAVPLTKNCDGPHVLLANSEISELKFGLQKSAPQLPPTSTNFPMSCHSIPFPRRPLKEAAPPAEHHLELLRGLHEAQRLRSALLSQAAAGVDQEAIERLPGGAVGDGSWPWLHIPFFRGKSRGFRYDHGTI